MNIAFLLTPKNEVIYEYIDATMRQVIERDGASWLYSYTTNR